jgi:hypothetical protein
MRRANKSGPVRVTIILTEMQRGRVDRAELSPASRTRSQRLQELLELGLQQREREMGICLRESRISGNVFLADGPRVSCIVVESALSNSDEVGSESAEDGRLATHQAEHLDGVRGGTDQAKPQRGDECAL